MLSSHECQITPLQSNGFVVCPCCGLVLSNSVFAELENPTTEYLKMPTSVKILRFKKLNLKAATEIEFESTFRLTSTMLENLELTFLKSHLNYIVKTIINHRKTANSPYIVRICALLFYFAREGKYPIELSNFKDYCSSKQILNYLARCGLSFKPLFIPTLLQKRMVEILMREGVNYDHKQFPKCLAIAKKLPTKPKLAVGVALYLVFKGKGVRQIAIAKLMNLNPKSIRKYS